MKAWIARDMLGDLHIFYTHKPQAILFQWVNTYDINGRPKLEQVGKYCKEIRESDLPKGINPKWKDKEPIEININYEVTR